MIGPARLLLAFILHLAAVIQGEGGVDLELLGPPLATVAVNRAAIGWDFGGWHGYAEPSERAIEIAWAAWRAGGDKGGDLFALSEDDIIRLGFDKQNWRNVGSEAWPVWVGRRWE